MTKLLIKLKKEIIILKLSQNLGKMNKP